MLNQICLNTQKKERFKVTIKKILKIIIYFIIFVIIYALIQYQVWLYRISFIESEKTRSMLMDTKLDFTETYWQNNLYEHRAYVSSLSERTKIDYYVGVMYLQIPFNSGDASLVFLSVVEGYEGAIANRLAELRNSSYFYTLGINMSNVDSWESTMRVIESNNEFQKERAE